MVVLLGLVLVFVLVLVLVLVLVVVTQVPSEDMYMAGRRGKCLSILHFYGDYLWAAGAREQIPELGPPDLAFLRRGEQGEQGEQGEEQGEEQENDGEEGSDGEPEEGVEEVKVAARGMESLDICDKDDCEVAEADVEADAEAAEVAQVDAEGVAGDAEAPSSPAAMDGLLRAALLQALRTSAGERKAALPMLASTLYRLHMIPSSPAPLDVKKSSYKKLGKFLASMERLGVLKTKELAKGVESVVWVDWEHEMVVEHRVVKVAKAEQEKEVEAVAPSERRYEPPVITELLMVTAAVTRLFKTAGIGKGSAVTPARARQVVTEYVKEKGLQDRGQVRLDELLAEVVLAKGDNGTAALRWEELVRFVVAKMSPGYSLQFQDQPALEFKGRLEPVELATATR